MANVNYSNPSAMSPYGDWQPSGFMAGWHYKDKMADYNKVRDLANQSQSLENMRREAELNTYNEEGVLRNIQRQRQVGEEQNLLGTLPAKGMLGREQASDELAAYRGSRLNIIQSKIYESFNEMQASRRKDAVEQLNTSANIAKSLPKHANWDDFLREAKRLRLDTKDYEQVAGPARDDMLEFLRNHNPEFLKHQQSMDETAYKEGAATERTRMNTQSQQEVARTTAQNRSGAELRENRLAQLQAEAFPILEKAYIVGWEGLDAREKATLSMWNTMNKEPFYGQAAAAQGRSATTQSAMESLGIPLRPTTPAPVMPPGAGPAQVNPMQQQPVPQGTNQFPNSPQAGQPGETVIINGKQMEVIVRRPDGTMKVYDPEADKMYEAKPQ